MFYWTEELYSYTKIYDSMTPLMRFCVDMKISGRKNAYIVKITKKSPELIKKTIYRAKQRYLAAFLSQSMPLYEKVDTSIYGGFEE